MVEVTPQQMREVVDKLWIEGRHKRLHNYCLMSRVERHKIEQILISSIKKRFQEPIERTLEYWNKRCLPLSMQRAFKYA